MRLYILISLLISVSQAKLSRGEYQPLSEKAEARIAFNLLEGLGFLLYPNATDCFNATKRLVDDTYFFNKNVTRAEQNGTKAYA